MPSGSLALPEIVSVPSAIVISAFVTVDVDSLIGASKVTVGGEAAATAADGQDTQHAHKNRAAQNPPASHPLTSQSN
jgi:hypothetical protein